MRVNRYLGKGYRQTAAHILQQAFHVKLRGILGSSEEVYQVILDSMDSKHIVIVRSNEGEVIGVAAYQHDDSLSLNITLQTMIKVYGVIRGLYKMAQLLIYFPTNRDKDVLYIDAIAVATHFRGQGVGKLLLQELEKIALEQGVSYVSLDVVKENTRAKKLYEQVGFKTGKYKELDNKTRQRLSCSGYYYMVKEISKKKSRHDDCCYLEVEGR